MDCVKNPYQYKEDSDVRADRKLVKNLMEDVRVKDRPEGEGRS